MVAVVVWGMYSTVGAPEVCSSEVQAETWELGGSSLATFKAPPSPRSCFCSFSPPPHRSIDHHLSTQSLSNFPNFSLNNSKTTVNMKFAAVALLAAGLASAQLPPTCAVRSSPSWTPSATLISLPAWAMAELLLIESFAD